MKARIRNLLKEKNAILLAHNYQLPEVQDIADLTGDSLELSIRAAKTDADIIVFCGVHFMAETASILSPTKKVLLPRLDAGCPMADMITPEQLSLRKKELGFDIPVVTYVNSSAAVKALSTICCTSANVVEVTNSINSDEVLITPDKNLAQYVAARTSKKVHLWNGFCPFHDVLTKEMVLEVKAKHPNAFFLAHPECRPEVTEIADAVFSTSGMIRFAKESNYTEFIIATEIGILYPLQKENPDKTFIPASLKMTCPHMKKTTLSDIIYCLETLTPEVKVPEEIRKEAIKSVEKMIASKENNKA